MEDFTNNKENLGLSSPFRGAGGGTRAAIFLIGFMGCGKSFWGRQLAAKLKLPFLDLDEQIEQVAGKSISDIFAKDGEEFFRRREREMLMHLTESTPAFVMSTGGGTPCFYNNIDYMNQKGTTIWINCSAECLMERLKSEKEKRPLIQSLADEDLKAYIIKKVGDRKIFYQQAAEIIYESELNLDTFLGKIFNTENKN